MIETTNNKHCLWYGKRVLLVEIKDRTVEINLDDETVIVIKTDVTSVNDIRLFYDAKEG